MNNQKSLIDYDSIEQLEAVINTFIHVCLLFNKSLGLMSFSLFTGIDDNTLLRWSSQDGEKVNPKRWGLIKNIKEHNKNMLISNLKDSPVGALAVANNDSETGLNWSANQLQVVYFVYVVQIVQSRETSGKRGGRVAIPGIAAGDPDPVGVFLAPGANQGGVKFFSREKIKNLLNGERESSLILPKEKDYNK